MFNNKVHVNYCSTKKPLYSLVLFLALLFFALLKLSEYVIIVYQYYFFIVEYKVSIVVLLFLYFIEVTLTCDYILSILKLFDKMG
jgi:hypothetical protein